LDARGAQVVDRQPGGDRRQKRLLGTDDDPVRFALVQTQVSLLDDVLGVARAAEHPVGDREEQRA
jgi:hypothetical protein